MNCVPVVIFLFFFMKYVKHVMLKQVYFIIIYLYFNSLNKSHFFLFYLRLCAHFNIL